MTPARALQLVLFPLLAASAIGPLALLLLSSIGRDWFAPALWPPSYTMESWRDALGGGSLGAAFLSSLALGVGTGALGVLVGAPFGRAMAGLAGWRRHLAAAAAFLPVAVPPIGLGVGLQVSALWLGLGGSLPGVLLSHLVPAAGYITLYFLGIFTGFDSRVEDEARTLGATRFEVLRRVTIPLLRRPLAEGFLLGFLVSWAQVALTLLIGGGRIRTLPLEVFAYLQAGQDRYAATGALLLVVPPLLTIGAVKLAAGRAEAFPV